ncbi:MAG: DUF4189 domain-containing protein [Rhodospirillales bacterium]|nr:MAG: DUF4189 domain-containing protein [Rhodospirillales bacterium]
MNRLPRAAALASALLFGAPAAHGQASPYWVTYAYDAGSGAWGLGWGRTDRDLTMSEALSRCGRPGCKLGNVTLARCIAVATGTSRGAGFGAANDAESAKAHALRFCRSGASGSTCEVSAVRCGG